MQPHGPAGPRGWTQRRSLAAGREKSQLPIWIKSHLSEADAVARGFTLEDHAGNALADVAAGEQALRHALPAEVQQQRAKRCEAILVYQQVIAAVREAAVRPR